MARDHLVTEGGYGPGTYVDKEFTPVPVEARRILHYLAEITPGFTKEEAVLDQVTFEGDDLPIIPGPAKSQVFVGLMSRCPWNFTDVTFKRQLSFMPWLLL